MSGVAKTPGPQPVSGEERLHALFAELHQRSGAAKLGLEEREFAAILREIGARHLPAATEAEALAFYRGLRLEELALARACAAGSERAWELFLARYRGKLYDAARAITREESSARDLADSLYAELFGTHEREGQRVSKLSYYTGRGSLEGWLRATLAQGYVNTYRRERRLVSLEEKTEEGRQFAAGDPPATAPPDPRLVEATDAALAALSAEERYILCSYYLDGRTLAEVARVLGVHESTISRKVEKITRALRQGIVDRLLAQGMSRRQAEEALDADVRDVTLNLRARLSQGTPGATFLSKGGEPE